MTSKTEFILRWGIVSTGLISQDFCTAIHSLPEPSGHVLQAVAARKDESAQEFAERFDIPHACKSYDELFARDDVDIVYIGSLNTAHKSQCLDAIAAGKHVLCEKPMTMNRAEQEEVLTAAETKGVFFMEALWTRFFPVINKLKEELTKKTIGDLLLFNSMFIQPISDVERINQKELGGGVTLDIGIYTIQLACLVFDHEKPIKITATGHLLDTGVDACATVVLLYSNNRIATLNYSCQGAQCAPTFIVGDKDVMQIPDYSWSPHKLLLPGNEVFEAEKLEFNEKYPTINFDNSLCLRFEAEAVREAISKGLKEHPAASHDNSRLIMSIIDEVRKQLGCKN